MNHYTKQVIVDRIEALDTSIAEQESKLRAAELNIERLKGTMKDLMANREALADALDDDEPIGSLMIDAPPNEDPLEGFSSEDVKAAVLLLKDVDSGVDSLEAGDDTDES